MRTLKILSWKKLCQTDNLIVIIFNLKLSKLEDLNLYKLVLIDYHLGIFTRMNILSVAHNIIFSVIL